MYNADRVVKSIAKCVTDSNKDKGVEMWLRKNLTFQNFGAIIRVV